MKIGFLQAILDAESNLLTTFHAPYGRFCLTRMPFGLNVAGYAIHWKLYKVLSGLQGVTGTADDMFVYGRREEEHDWNPTAFLNQAQQHGCKIGVDKIQFTKISVKFHGFQLTTDGYKPRSKKIQDP